MAGGVPQFLFFFFRVMLFFIKQTLVTQILLFINRGARTPGYSVKGFDHLHCQGPGFACTYESSVKFGNWSRFGCSSGNENFVCSIKIKEAKVCFDSFVSHLVQKFDSCSSCDAF